MNQDEEVNTRRYARNMNEAFPGSPEYACSIEIYTGTKWEVVIFRCLLVVGLLFLLAAWMI